VSEAVSGGSEQPIDPSKAADLLAQSRLRLDALSAALAALDEEGAGCCVHCGRELPADLLAADPLAVRCPSHQQPGRE
jgi:RNA polymerase-binding transcription factor DksA